ncbi:MAG: hypothetical protein ACTIK0_06295, partial [Ruoffia tabacinasalis]
PGPLAEIHVRKDEHCNTFIDDIVGALAAAAASRIAHSQPQTDEVNVNSTPKESYEDSHEN